MRIILTLLISILSITTLFAQQENKLQFSNELQGKDAYIPLSNNSVKGNDNKMNILFKNDSIYWPTIHVAIDVLQKDSFYYVLGSYPDNQFLTKFDLNGSIISQKTNVYHDEPHSLYYNTSNKLTQLSNGRMAYMYTELVKDSFNNYPYNYKKTIVKYYNENLSINSIYTWGDSVEFNPAGGIVSDDNIGFTYCGYLGSRILKWNIPWNGDTTEAWYFSDSIYLGIVKVDSSMQIIKKNKLYLSYPPCNNKDFYVEELEKAHDGGYIVGGHMGVCGGVNGWSASTAFAIKFDSLLNENWRIFFEDSIGKSDSPFNIVPSKDGSSYIYTRGHTKTQSIAYGKFDEQGNILWEKYFRKTLDTNGMAGELTIWDRPYGVIEKANGDIIFGSRINGNRATGLVRTDSLGNVKWSRIISTNYGDSLLYYSYIFNLKNPIGEGALLVGRVHTKGAFLIRTDSLGCTLPNCLDTTLHVGIKEILELKEKKLIVYPNPASNKINIVFEKAIEGSNQIIIYNIFGQEIMHQQLEGNTKYSLNISSLKAGLYFYTIVSDNNVLKSAKFIKQ